MAGLPFDSRWESGHFSWLLLFYSARALEPSVCERRRERLAWGDGVLRRSLEICLCV